MASEPVVFLINNDGYTIERVICDRPYNDIQPWDYHRLLEVFGGGEAFDVHTEGQLEEALAQAAESDQLVFIEIHTDRLDCSESLKKAGETWPNEQDRMSGDRDPPRITERTLVVG